MKTTGFIGYIGNHDFHDSVIRQVSRRANVVHVRIRGANGEDYDVAFDGVSNMRANRPAGKELYAVSEMRGRASMRKFLFDSWAEDGEAALEIDAEGVRISKIASRS